MSEALTQDGGRGDGAGRSFMPGSWGPDAGGCVIALHNGTSEVGRRPPKIGFWASDIAAARQELIERRLPAGAVRLPAVQERLLNIPVAK